MITSKSDSKINNVFVYVTRITWSDLSRQGSIVRKAYEASLKEAFQVIESIRSKKNSMDLIASDKPTRETH